MTFLQKHLSILCEIVALNSEDAMARKFLNNS